jgi:response regulator RpfG family c-di-GMP phosphodiesterase
MNKTISLLYIDDEPINLKLFNLNFNEMFSIETALSGYDGLKILEAFPNISVVISDLKMPEMNGIEFIRLAKEKYPDKSYFILTGFELTKEIHAALEEGIILKYFSKPFNVREIEKAVLQCHDIVT